MGFTEEGFSRLTTIGNHASNLIQILDKFENQDEDIFSGEYRFLRKACEIFDTILYGAGCFEEKYLHDSSISLNDFHLIYSMARDNFSEDIKDAKDLKREFARYRGIIKYLEVKKEIPNDKMDYGKMKNFLVKYNKTIRETCPQLFEPRQNL